MSTTKKSTVFLGLTFLFSWAAAIGGWALGAAQQPLSALIALVLMMAGPAIAATICAFAFEKGRRVEALGLRFKPNWWWLFAYLAPLTLIAMSVLVTLLLSDRTLGDLGANILLAAEQAGADVSTIRGSPALVPLILLQALVLGALFNSFALTFTEELGWRGYLHDLWRRFGFWRTSLATGVIWGVWHAQAIYLFGHNYSDDRVIGVVLFVGFCTLLSPLMTLVRDRGGSTFAAGILHGTINATAGLSIMWLSSPDFPWNGILGIGGYVTLALSVVVVALLQLKAPAPAARPVAT